MEILDDLKRKYRSGNIIIKLIFVNVGIFLVQFLLSVFGLSSVNNYFMVPADPLLFLMRPWALLSYQFMHADLMHILFNMLWLYWFGEMFLRFFNQKQMLSVYLLGGFAGAALFFITYNLLPIPQAGAAVLLGASAAVTAIGVAVAVYRPDLKINLMLFGPVKLKYLVIIMIAIDFINIKTGQNVGGHFSHIGGAIFGFFFGQEIKKGRDITGSFTRFMDWLVGSFKSRRKTKMKVVYGTPKNEREKDFNYNARKKVSQEEIDRILEKISRSGYDSLNSDEKDKLFRASK